MSEIKENKRISSRCNIEIKEYNIKTNVYICNILLDDRNKGSEFFCKIYYPNKNNK